MRIQETKIFFCKNCGIEISKEKNDEAIENKFLPLCEKCEPEIKEKFLKWSPIFQKFKF